MNSINKNSSKQEVFKKITDFLESNNFNIVSKDFDRPWGGFFVIDEKQAAKFISMFFQHLKDSNFSEKNKLSPKLLIVEPNKRLSWQYHNRRSEIWKLIAGNAKIVFSDNDEEKNIKNIEIGEIINLKCGERHRLVGDENNYGIIAEIWQHTDPENPSDEEDIIRVQDDFGR